MYNDMPWWLYIIIAYVVALVFFHIYVRYFSSQRATSDSKRIPIVIEPWYFPFLGPVLSMLDFENSLQKWCANYGENFTLYILGKYLSIVTRYKDIKRYYHASDSVLSLGKVGLFMMGTAYPESQYLEQYNVIPYLQKVITQRNLPFMLLNTEMVTEEYFNPKDGQFWKEYGDETIVNFFDFVYRLIVRINSANFVSQRVYRNHVEEITKLYTALDVEKNVLNPIISSIKNRLGLKSERDTTWERWIAILMPDIERCLKLIDTDIEPTEMDIIYEAVKYAKEELGKRGEPFTPRLVAFLIFSTFFPGQFTSYVTTSYVLLEWIRHKDDEIGRRIKEEIDCAPPVDALTMEHLNSMKYIEACIYEAVRLATDFQISLRYVDNEFVLSDDARIPPGNIIATPTTRADDLYLNPREFDPERHLPPREENMSDPYRAIPFGRGKHPCTGEKYAKMEIKVILIQLARMCEMEIMKESVNFKSTINRKQLIGPSRPTKPIYVKISKKQH